MLAPSYAQAEEPPSSDPASSSVSDVGAVRHNATSESTPEEHWERLRIGLERAARKYPTPEAHMAELKEGLERLARSLSSSAE